MKYTLTRACGHEETVNIYGNAKERENKIKWYESTNCTECWKAEGCEEVEMAYREYKENFADCKTKKDSYDKDAKTIIVYVPREEAKEENKEEKEFLAAVAELESKENAERNIENQEELKQKIMSVATIDVQGAEKFISLDNKTMVNNAKFVYNNFKGQSLDSQQKNIKVIIDITKMLKIILDTLK